VTYLTGALYVHHLWFYKHQHENRVRSQTRVACQHVAFSLPFAAILVNCAPNGEMHNYCTPHIIKENIENFLIHRCNYILLSQVYCVWQVIKTPTIILNYPVHREVGRAKDLPAPRQTAAPCAVKVLHWRVLIGNSRLGPVAALVNSYLFSGYGVLLQD